MRRDDFWKLSRLKGFQWDDNNNQKNWLKHQVEPRECEEVFFNRPLFLQADVKHSSHEKRYYVLGITNNKRKLFISFTFRDNLIRVISARDQSRKEREKYEKK